MTSLYGDAACTHPVQAGQSLSLTTPIVENGVTLFRATLYVGLRIDDRAEKPQVLPASSLHVRYEATTVSVSQSTHAWVSDWQGDEQTLTVKLVFPVPIGAVESSSYSSVALYRVDGQAVAADPTVEGATGAPLPEAFVGASFRATFSGLRVRVALDAGGKSAKLGKGTADARALGTRSRQVFDLLGSPTSPRLRLLDAAGAEQLWQWLDPGVHASSSYAAAGAELAKALEPALQRALALDRQHNPIPQGSRTLALPLLIESDAPCSVLLDAADLELALSTELLQDPARLAFDGSAQQERAVALPSLPSQLLTLAIQATLVERAASTATEPAEPANGAGNAGVRLEEGAGAAIVWDAERPYRAAGFAVAFHALSAEVALVAALFADAGGRLAGPPIAEGSLDVATEAPDWLRFRWEPVDLQPGRYWLRVLTSRGSGIWLGTSSPTPQPIWFQKTTSESVAGGVPLALLKRPLEPRGAHEGALPLDFALNGIALDLTTADPSGDTLTGALDIAAAGLAGAASWQLEASSASALDVTVSSARVTYRG